MPHQIKIYSQIREMMVLFQETLCLLPDGQRRIQRRGLKFNEYL